LLSTLDRGFYLLVFIWVRGGLGLLGLSIILFADRYARIRPAKGEIGNQVQKRNLVVAYSVVLLWILRLERLVAEGWCGFCVETGYVTLCLRCS